MESIPQKLNEMLEEKKWHIEVIDNILNNLDGIYVGIYSFPAPNNHIVAKLGDIIAYVVEVAVDGALIHVYNQEEETPELIHEYVAELEELDANLVKELYEKITEKEYGDIEG